MSEKFAKVSENQITTAIVKDFCEKLLGNVETDCIVIGAGPSGLMAAKELAKGGFKVLVIEANNYLGGGFWIGGYLMNTLTFRAPAQDILEELNIPYKEAGEGLFTASGPNACSKLISRACDTGIKILNMTKFDDVVLRENSRVAGAVINWTPVSALPRAITCVDPIALESKLVIDATGHDAIVVNSLVKRGLLNIKGFSGMWVEESEDMVVERTSEIHPGLIVTGMAVATVFGLSRMGPTFGGMLLSGKRAARIAKEKLIKMGSSRGSQEEMMEKIGER